MKVIILAAGYGTRLQKDIRNDPEQKYKDLLDVPKPLVPIGGECLISRWMTTLRKISAVCGVTEVYLVTNHHYVHKFQNWAIHWPDVLILDDGSCSNESRLGAVGDINLCIDHFQISDDILIIGGDTIFYKDFDLKTVLDKYHAKKISELGGAMVTCYRCKDSETTKFGILEVNRENQVTEFLEKPDPLSTQSRWACPCFYILSRNACQLIPEFLEEKKNSPLKEKDAPGHFIRYVQQRKPVYAVVLKSGRFDIGSLQSYIECDQYFSK